VKSISVKEFLREYRNLREPTMVLKHAKPMGVWQPVDSEAEVAFVLPSYNFNSVSMTTSTSENDDVI
jgi:hypothetical protein